MSVINTDPIWIDNAQELSELCQRWQQQAAIAIDTEFMRTTTFYPQAALYQVADGEGCYLIDPLVIDDFSSFKALLENEQVTKVLHSCSEDLEVFQTHLGVVPSPIFDSQWAAACAGYDFSMGYARMIQTLLDIEVPKSETRSDWLQRPLSASQLKYAALDVAYLIVAYGLLLKSLKAQDRLHWVKEDCAAMVIQAKTAADFDTAYINIKSSWKLNPRQLAALQNLAAWREAEARERNVPRNRLIKERALWDLARNLPKQVNHLQRIEGLTPRAVRSDGDELLALIDEARERPESALPPRLPKPLSPQSGDLVKALKAYSRTVAEELQVPAEILLRKKDVEAIVRSGLTGDYCLPERLRGWRQEVVGDGLLQQAQTWQVSA